MGKFYPALQPIVIMKKIRFLLKLGMGLFFLLLGVNFAQSEDLAQFAIGTDSLTISPSTATVIKGSTQQFTTTQTVASTSQGGAAWGCGNGGTTGWSVVGGDTNGTISADGLFTPPTTLPENPAVTIRYSNAGQTAQATVNLRTATSISFGTATQVNTTAIDINGLLAEALFGGVGNHITSRVGSLETYFLWLGIDSGGLADLFFNQQSGLSGLVGEQNLFDDPSATQIAQSVVIDNNLNPGIFMTGASGLQYLSSQDGGVSFGTPVTIQSVSTVPATAASTIDANNDLHVVYTNNFDADDDDNDGNGDDGLVETGQIKYAQSTDGGLTWSAQVIQSSTNVQIDPALAVSEDGQEIYVCYADDLGTDETFEIMFTKSTDGGTTWTTPLELKESLGISPQEGISVFCQIALGPNNEIYLTYNETLTGSTDNHYIYFTQSTNGGSSFSTPVQVSTQSLTQVPYTFFSHFMAVDSLGRIDIIWSLDVGATTAPSDTIMYARSTDGGVSFSSNVALAGGLATIRAIPIGLTHDISGRVHILYLDTGTSTTEYNVFYIRGE